MKQKGDAGKKWDLRETLKEVKKARRKGEEKQIGRKEIRKRGKGGKRMGWKDERKE